MKTASVLLAALVIVAGATAQRPARPAKPPAQAKAPAPAPAPKPAGEDVLLRAMQDEMARCRKLRVMSLEQPYYIEYALHDGENVSATATLGALINSNRIRFRLPRFQIRVGDYDLDNTNFIASDVYTGTRYEVDEMPLDDSYPVLRHYFWLATDMAYRAAVEGFSRKKAALRSIAAGSYLPDFNRVEPVQKTYDTRPLALDEAAWSARVRRLSALLRKYPETTLSSVTFQGGTGFMYLVTSEGTKLRLPEGSSTVRIVANGQAADGMPVRDAEIYYSFDSGLLPPEAEFERAAQRVGSNIAALVQAPVGDAYAGPVIFEGAAAGQLLAQTLGKNLALPRRPIVPPGRAVPLPTSELEGRIGSRILPEWIDVVDDPTQAEWHGRRLFGHYDYDLEGVPAAAVTVVEKGVLKDFLATRQPLPGIPLSNGHARLPGLFGAKAAGVGNLFVRASNPVSSAALKNKLIDICRQRNKPYGLVVRKLDFPSTASIPELRRTLAGMAGSGGTHPVSPPLLVYRIYPDGREELVRGLRFRSVNARTMKDILAASDDVQVFDYYDSNAPFAVVGGAAFVSEASVISPSLLIDDVELERADQDLPKPPIVPPPPMAALETRSGGGGVF